MNTQKKTSLHKNNPHKYDYDFNKLSLLVPELKEFIKLNPAGTKTIDFSNAEAVRLLNKAILLLTYKVDIEIPDGFLCPPIPGRADYIHYLKSEIVDKYFKNKNKIKILDIGTGASCIYPIIGFCSYGWDFLASELNPISLESAKNILAKNNLENIKLLFQENKSHIFKGIIEKDMRIDITMCNPPFFQSREEAIQINARKNRNLNKKITKNTDKNSQSKTNFNFRGEDSEIWCKGGELAFIRKIVKESFEFKNQICWFSSLVSKSENIKPIEKLIKKLGAKNTEIVEMKQGQKTTRFIAWTFV